MTKRIMAVTIAMVAVSLFGVSAGQAQQVRLLRVVPFQDVEQGASSWTAFNTRIIVIGTPDPPSLSLPNCGVIPAFSPDVFHVVVIRTASFPALHLDMFLTPDSEIQELHPGDRITEIVNDIVDCCVDETITTVTSCGVGPKMIRRIFATLQQPSSAGAALFTSPVELDTDALGVVTGHPNDDGTQKVIFKTQGSPAQQVDIASFDELFAADVLRDLIDLGPDPDTGQHLYFAFIEY